MLRLEPQHIKDIYYSFNGRLQIVPKKYDNVYDNWYFRNLATPSDMTEHLVYLEEIAKDKIVLELGTRYGVSTSAFCHSAKYVYTVDIEDCSMYIPDGIENVTFMHTKSTDIDVIDFDGINIDIVLIDTEHTYKQVINEFSIIYPLYPDIVVFHDVQIAEVKEAIEDICKEYNLTYKVMGNVYPIAIIEL
jgi:hypothetical protein